MPMQRITGSRKILIWGVHCLQMWEAVLAMATRRQVNILLRKKPIPVEELNLPQIIIFIIPSGDDTWKFEYTVAITLDDGTQLPPFGSNVNGITGIIMDQDNPSYSGIGTELNPGRQRHTAHRSNTNGPY